MRKNSKHIKYEETLDLTPYMIGCPQGTKALYRLVGVLIHEGSTMHAGHYYSYVKNSNGTWALKDDESSNQVWERMDRRKFVMFSLVTRLCPFSVLEFTVGGCCFCIAAKCVHPFLRA